MINMTLRYGYDGKLCSVRPLSPLSIFLQMVLPFFLTAHNRVSPFNCPVLRDYARSSNSRRLDKRGLIYFTSGVSAQQPSTIPLPVCLLIVIKPRILYVTDSKLKLLNNDVAQLGKFYYTYLLTPPLG